MAEHDKRFGIEQLDDEPIELDGDDAIDLDAGSEAGGKITTFGAKDRHENRWDRTPNVTGKGAIHCKVFHCKLREDGLAFLEGQINEWLDGHPEYEVKFVTSSIGELKTKTVTEPALFLTVWV
jgi:hypothetical protein